MTTWTSDELNKIGIIFRLDFRSTGRAKGRNPGMGQGATFYDPKKFFIFGIGARPSPFNIGHAQGVQALGDLDLVRNGKRDSFGLGTIPEGCVINDDA